MNIIPLNTFDQVVAHYAYVKPLRGKHKSDDVRPLGSRTRKTERIVKIDDNTYLITDAHYGDPVFATWYHADVAQRVVTREEQINLAPIVWRRHPDGRETVTVRNATGGWRQHNMRYNFLRDFLPWGLVFCMNRGGNHYIAATNAPPKGHRARDSVNYGDKQYLSISTTVPHYVVEEIKRNAALTPNLYRVKYLEWMTVADDGAALTYERKGAGQWGFVGGGRPRTVELPRVMLDVKAPYRVKIATFIDYCIVMRPLLEISYAQESKFMEELRAWQIDTKTTWPTWRRVDHNIPPEVAREMLDPEHPMYLQFAYALMSAHMGTMPTTKEGLAKMKASMNNWINKTLGFVTKVVEERK